MESFYVSIVFLGITLVVIALVMILYDRKKGYDYVKLIEEKKHELVNIINDADQMVEELNKFSDYVVTQMEIKNEELSTNLRNIDERAKQISASINVVEKSEVKSLRNEVSMNYNKLVNSDFETSEMLINTSELVMDKVVNNNSNAAYVQTHKYMTKGKDNVIPMNNKYKEVIQLANNGMSNTEIARKLNMGKGEIELILGMNK